MGGGRGEGRRGVGAKNSSASAVRVSSERKKRLPAAASRATAGANRPENAGGGNSVNYWLKKKEGDLFWNDCIKR